MALKDWKKREPQHTGESGQTIFEGKKEVIIIEKVSQLDGNEYWEFEVFAGEDNRIIIKRFETKSQAMGFAKNYMRNH